ncbi:KCNC1 [Mytilus coruscus]|uniref:KCNC1 n=1 Tax=Mytilus coruscus TaxID=42192 RepID=A0A6J8A125_MYTCO|nr:KCNC1 [Mytilus coruscus]
MEEKRIEIDVNGIKFKILQDIVDKITLSDCEASKIFLDKKSTEDNVVYFERNAGLFGSILCFYQGRTLHVPSGVCLGEFKDELKFWGIDPKHLSKCCMGQFITFCDDQDVLQILENDQIKKENNRTKLKSRKQSEGMWKYIQAKGWLILEEPSTSIFAKVYFFTSAMFVLASIFGLVCQTHPFLEEILSNRNGRSILEMISRHIKIVRIFRLFRLVKNFTGFRVLMYAVRASGFEVLLMSMFLVVAMLMFGAFAFFSGDTAFPSIPDSFWWAVVTMTTVGYGDMVPTIGLSKAIGGLCAITGVCLLAVIIPIFVNNFVMFYNYSKVWRTASENDYANVSKPHPNSCHKAVPHSKVTPQPI